MLLSIEMSLQRGACNNASMTDSSRRLALCLKCERTNCGFCHLLTWREWAACFSVFLATSSRSISLAAMTHVCVCCKLPHSSHVDRVCMPRVHILANDVLLQDILRCMRRRHTRQHTLSVWRTGSISSTTAPESGAISRYSLCCFMPAS